MRARHRRPMGAQRSSPSVVFGPESAPRKTVAFLLRASGAAFIVSNLQDSFTVSLFLALLLSVVLLLFALTQATGLTGIFNGTNTSRDGTSGFSFQRISTILLKAVADFGAVAAALYYVVLYHSRMEGAAGGV